VRCLTNNRNRAAQDVRGVLNGGGGKLAEPGSVAWMFEPKGIVIVSRSSAAEDDVFMVSADAGAEDVRASEESFEVVTPASQLGAVRTALESSGAQVESAELTQVPKSTVQLEEAEARRMLRLLDALEELDDVQEVFANFDVSDEVLASTA
jgi:YebC/PmpR family DNA-binding regulatory protein